MTLRVASMIPISNTGHTYMCAHCCAECRLVQLHWFQDFLGTTPLMRCLATLVGLVIGILKCRGFTRFSRDFEGGHGAEAFSAWKNQQGLHKCLKLDPFTLLDPTLSICMVCFVKVSLQVSSLTHTLWVGGCEPNRTFEDLKPKHQAWPHICWSFFFLLELLAEVL